MMPLRWATLPIAVLVCGLVTSGCAVGGQVGALPQVPDPARAATVVAIRPYGFEGSGATITITVDGAEIYELGPDEHVAIPVAAGEHMIGAKGWDPALLFTRIHPTETIQAESGRVYYFRVTLGRISRAPEAEGRELVSTTAPVGTRLDRSQELRPAR